MTNQEMILECLMSALFEIKEDLPDFMQSEEMFEYLRDSWRKRIENLLINSRNKGRKIMKEEWKVVLDYVKGTIPLRHDSNLTKVSVKFGHKFLEELNNKQKGI